MDDSGGKLVFINEVAFECASLVKASGAKGATVVARTLAEQDMESKVAASGECKVAAGTTVRGLTGLVVCDRERGWRARRAVTSWERQSGEGVAGERGGSGVGRVTSGCLRRIVFMLSSGYRRWYAFVRSGACV